jgi:hypothetical protein
LFYKSKTKHESIRVNIYDKSAERLSKRKEILALEEGVVIYEEQLLNRHLDYKKSKGFSKDLEPYLNNEMFITYFERFIKPLCYTGSFFSFKDSYAP